MAIVKDANLFRSLTNFQTDLHGEHQLSSDELKPKQGMKSSESVTV